MDFTENVKNLFQSTQTTEDSYATASHAELYNLREQTTDIEKQNVLAKYEHRAFAREWVQEVGPIGAASLAVAIPTYAAGKATGILPSDEKTSTDYMGEIKQGFIGVGEGLKAFFSGDTEAMPKSTAQQQTTNEKQSPQTSKIDDIFNQLIQVESGGKHLMDGELTESSKGALGVTQIMPKTGDNPGYGVEPLQGSTEEEYLRFGREYLNAMYRVFQNEEQAIAAYNAGPGNIHRAISKANRTGRDWKEFIPEETKNYIIKVSGKNGNKETKGKKQKADVIGIRG